jgi:hypothetical protein
VTFGPVGIEPVLHQRSPKLFESFRTPQAAAKVCTLDRIVQMPLDIAKPILLEEIMAIFSCRCHPADGCSCAGFVEELGGMDELDGHAVALSAALLPARDR